MLLLTLILELMSFSHGCQSDSFKVANSEALQRFEAAFPFLKQSVKQVWHVETAKGDYIGQLNCSSGFRHGWGEMRWANGTLYGPENIFIYSQGDRYFGQWVQDKQEGIGTLESRTGIYIGSWKSGLQNGNGTAIYNNGNRYDGSFENGFKHGQGKFVVTLNGDVYTGDFRRGVRYGQGIEKYGLTGETYVGEFVNDTRWGLGTAYYKDGGPKYIGSWVNGFPQGSNGTLFLQNGQRYVGEFLRGKPWGQGILYGANGDIIKEGTFGDPAAETNEAEAPFLLQPKSNSWLENLNWTNNKYSNLIRNMMSFLQESWPFS